MDTEQEIWRLAGEAIATQQVLVGLCMGLVASGEAGGFIVTNAFDFADTVTDAGALKLGGANNPIHRETTVRVLEQLREAALGTGEDLKRTFRSLGLGALIANFLVRLGLRVEQPPQHVILSLLIGFCHE